MMKYKFQIENGRISVGSDEIEINDYVGQVEPPISASMRLLIKAHGGILVEAHGGILIEDAKPKSTKTGARKKRQSKTSAKETGG
jgi:hypothetical protein